MTARLSALEEAKYYRKGRELCLVSKGGPHGFISFSFVFHP